MPEMNWIRLMLDAVAMAAYFNIFAVAVMAYDSRLILPGYPKSIQKAAPAAKEERRFYLKWMIFGLLLPLMIYGTASALAAGATGFWRLFFTFYIQWLIISFTDFFLLDILLVKRWRARIMIPGTENHPSYEPQNWLRELALTEHLLQWPLLLAPALAGFQALAGWLIIK